MGDWSALGRLLDKVQATPLPSALFYLMGKEQRLNSKEEVLKVLSPEDIPLKKIEMRKLKH